jgi:hypothetical protein
VRHETDLIRGHGPLLHCCLQRLGVVGAGHAREEKTAFNNDQI